MLNKLTLKQFQEEIIDKNIHTGGGVVSALTSSFAASLVILIANSSLDSISNKKTINDILKLKKNAESLKNKLEVIIKEDKKVLSDLSKNRKKGNLDEIKLCLKKAIELPLEVRKISQEIEKLAYKISKIGDKTFMADSKTAIHLSHAASKSALESVKSYKNALSKLK